MTVKKNDIVKHRDDNRDVAFRVLECGPDGLGGQWMVVETVGGNRCVSPHINSEGFIKVKAEKPPKKAKKTFDVIVARTVTQSRMIRVKAENRDEAIDLVEAMDLEDKGDWDVYVSGDLIEDVTEVKPKRRSR